MKTGDTIRALRKERMLSQIELATKAGIAVNSLRLYEANKREPKLDSLKRIAQALGVDVYSLVDFDTASHMLENRINAVLQLEPKEQQLLEIFATLNDAGQDVAIERVNELAELLKYKNAPPEGET